MIVNSFIIIVIIVISGLVSALDINYISNPQLFNYLVFTPIKLEYNRL